MVFSRYYVVLSRCCGFKNNIKSISTRFNDNQNNIVNRNLSTKQRNKFAILGTKMKNNYSNLTTTNVISKNETPNLIEKNSTIPKITFLNDDEKISTRNNDFDLDEYFKELDRNRPAVFDDCVDDLSHITPEFPVTFNFAAYADKSPTIQRLAELGVDFSKIEKRKGIAEILLRLDFEKDMKSHIRFLNDCGVPSDCLGEFLTKNPLIFKADLDDLYTRIRYLRAHKFSKDTIARIVTKNPFWLMFSTKRIDARLGFFQKEFNLSGGDVRQVAGTEPRLVTYNLEHVKENTFSIREEMGFDRFQTKAILKKKPRIWMKSRRLIVEVFDYVHNKMMIPHSVLAEQPEILTYKLNRIKTRHEYLVTLKRDQYDPTKPMYVSLYSLVSKSDAEFCLNVAKTPVETYNLFLKSL